MTRSRRYSMDNVNWRLCTYLLTIPIFLLYVLTLTGCVSNSPGIPNIFLVKLQGADQLGDYELRVGYFGLCGSSQEGLSCYATTGSSSEQLTANLRQNLPPKTAEDLPIDVLVDLAVTLQSRIILCLSAGAGILFFLGVLFLVLLGRGLKASQNATALKRRRFYRRALIFHLWVSVALALASADSVTQTTGALEYVTRFHPSESSIIISAGRSLAIMQWMVFAISVIFTLGITQILRRSCVGCQLGSKSLEEGSASTKSPPPSSGAGAPAPPPPPPPPPPPAA
ncbi:hypothetical protein FQN54_009725 [Arachnomyces sp. PD_36]|nr:hypothetical protein FQN54_009725 [Arachnomyces sp. PD_36]